MFKLYLLVEWVRKTNRFDPFEVVAINADRYYIGSLRVGNVILILRRGERIPRQGCILRIAGLKDNLLDERDVLVDEYYDRLNHPIEVECCTDSDDYSDSAEYEQQNNAGPNEPVLQAQEESTPMQPTNNSNNVPNHVTENSPPSAASSNNVQHCCCGNQCQRKSTNNTGIQTDPVRNPKLEYLHVEGKKLIKQIYQNFVTLIGDVVEVNSMVVDYPDLCNVLGVNTERGNIEEIPTRNDINTNKDASSQGVNDANDQQAENAVNIEENSAPSNPDIKTPDNVRQDMSAGNSFTDGQAISSVCQQASEEVLGPQAGGGHSDNSVHAVRSAEAPSEELHHD